MSQPDHLHDHAHAFSPKLSGPSGGKTQAPPPFQLKTGQSNPAAPIQRQAAPPGSSPAATPAKPKRTGGKRREDRLEWMSLGLLSPDDYNFPSQERLANEEELINPSQDWNGNALPANWDDGVTLTETEYEENHSSYEASYNLGGHDFKLKAHFIQGTSDKKAMVVGGIHGSERAGIEVAERLLKNLQSPLLRPGGGSLKPYYSVLLIPSLMPNNYNREHSADDRFTEVKKGKKSGNYIRKGDGAPLPKDFKKHKIRKRDRLTNPNRQAPSLGKGADPADPRDDRDRPMEPELYMLTALFNRYKPSRIAMLHGHGKTQFGGIYADPQTDEKGIAQGYHDDRELALAVATRTEDEYDKSFGKKGKVEVMPGNTDSKVRSTERAAEKKAKIKRPIANAIYPGHNDPDAVAAGKQQPRTDNRGRSFGSWLSTGVSDPAHPEQDRPSVTTFTLETRGNKRSDELSGKKAEKRAAELESIAIALEEVFLGPDAATKAPAQPPNPQTSTP